MKVDVRTPEGLLLGTLDLPTDREGVTLCVPTRGEAMVSPLLSTIPEKNHVIYHVRIEKYRPPYARDYVPAVRWTGTLQQLRECYDFTEVTHAC